MRQIAKEVGLTAGALYRYFPTKHALMVAYWSESIGALHSQLVRIAGDAADPRDCLLQMVRAYVAFALEDRPRFRTMFLENDHGELGEFGRSATLLAPFHIFRDAQILWASVHGVLTLAENIDPMDFGDVAALADLAAQTTLAGLT
jgi:AcrR family transcriptional regulator